jgi:hypothetical protein
MENGRVKKANKIDYDKAFEVYKEAFRLSVKNGDLIQLVSKIRKNTKIKIN